MIWIILTILVLFLLARPGRRKVYRRSRSTSSGKTRRKSTKPKVHKTKTKASKPPSKAVHQRKGVFYSLSRRGDYNYSYNHKTHKTTKRKRTK